MAKRSSTGKQKTPPPSTRGKAPSQSTESVNALERQVVAFAEQLGYVAGSIRVKATGMDRDRLSRQLTSVRDGAKHLLEQLASGVASRVRRTPASKRPVRKARSGGTVDAPGKKHRKPAPAGPPAAVARAHNARARAATPGTRMMNHRARQG